MKSFLSRFGALSLSMLSGFDRLRFRGCSRWLSHDRWVNSYWYQRDRLLKEFPGHAEALTKRLVRGSEALAQADGHKMHYRNSPASDKEAIALQIASERGLGRGRMAILSCLESCRTFRVRTQPSSRLSALRQQEGRGQHFDHYFLHEHVGLCYMRLQSWFPCSARIGLQGRTWLYQQLQRAGIGYRRQDHSLLAVDAWPRAQPWLDEQLQTDGPSLLDGLVAPCHPLGAYRRDEARLPYYWTTAPSAWATDLFFQRAEDSARLYPRLARHGIDVLGRRDVLHFWARCLPQQRFHHSCKSEATMDVRERPEGTRAKLWYEHNSVTIYDKPPHGPRLETTIHQPGQFTIYRAQAPADKTEERWQAGQLTRPWALLRVHGLIINVQKTHRDQVSAGGRRLLSALLAAHVADVGKLTATA